MGANRRWGLGHYRRRDPVHFGIIMVYNLAIGIVAPPGRHGAFVSCAITGKKIGAVTTPLPILALQVACLLLVHLPAISPALPRLFGL